MLTPNILGAVQAKRIRTSQPQEPARIDWSNPITRGLVVGTVPPMAKVATSKGVSQLTTIGDSWSAEAGIPVPGGMGILSGLHVLAFQRIIARIAYSALIYTSAANSSSTVSGFVLSDNNVSANLNSPQIHIKLHSAAWGGNVTAFTSTTTKSVWYPDKPTVYQVDWAADKNSGYPRLFSGSTEITRIGGTALNTSINFNNGGSAPELFNFSSSATQENLLFAYWSRSLETYETKSLSDNPWQIFAPDDLFLPSPSLSQREYASPRQSRMLGTSSGVPGTAVISGVSSVGGKVRTSQPQDLCGVDWSNPFTNGLVEVVPAYLLRTVVNSDQATTSGTMTSVVSTRGIARRSVLSGSNKDIYSGAWSRIPAPLTLLTVYRMLTHWYTTRVSGNLTSGTNGYGLTPNATNFRAMVSRSGVNTILTGSAISSALKADALVIDATNASLFENGILTVAPTAHGGMATATGSFTHGSENAASNTDEVEYYVSYLWDRALSGTEIKSLSDNPWQIFAPDSSLIWTAP